MEEYKDLNPVEDEVVKEDEDLIFKEIAKIEGVTELLRLYLSRDMKTFFNAPKEQQEMTRGAFYRTQYILNKVKSNSVVGE